MPKLIFNLNEYPILCSKIHNNIHFIIQNNSKHHKLVIINVVIEIERSFEITTFCLYNMQLKLIELCYINLSGIVKMMVAGYVHQLGSTYFFLASRIPPIAGQTDRTWEPSVRLLFLHNDTSVSQFPYKKITECSRIRSALRFRFPLPTLSCAKKNIYISLFYI